MRSLSGRAGERLRETFRSGADGPGRIGSVARGGAAAAGVRDGGRSGRGTGPLPAPTPSCPGRRRRDARAARDSHQGDRPQQGAERDDRDVVGLHRLRVRSARRGHAQSVRLAGCDNAFGVLHRLRSRPAPLRGCDARLPVHACHRRPPARPPRRAAPASTATSRSVPAGPTVASEVRGGVVTFFTMAYIIVLNPLIIGTVPDADGNFLGGGSTPNLAMVAAATALVAGLLTILMGVVANFPLALATGLGLNAFVVYFAINPLEQLLGVIYCILVLCGGVWCGCRCAGTLARPRCAGLSCRRPRGRPIPRAGCG